jgi:hypothetical protein
MARWTKCVVFLFASLLTQTHADAQTFFRTWFDAPSAVIAGESFAVDVWAETSGDWVGEGEFSSFFSAFLMSIEVSGDLETFDSITEASINFNFAFSIGTPNDSWLLDVIGFNIFGPIEGGTMDNPVRLFSFDVSTVLGETGELNLLHQPSSVSPDLLRWYVDPFVGDDWYIGSADDNSVLNAEPFTVRVVPASATSILFALAGLGAARRRR